MLPFPSVRRSSLKLSRHCRYDAWLRACSVGGLAALGFLFPDHGKLGDVLVQYDIEG